MLSSTSACAWPNADSLQIASTSACSSYCGPPRHWRSRRDDCTASTSSRARAALTGAEAKATSLNSSTAVPPEPNITMGPNVGSMCMPMMVSTPPLSMGVISTPSMRASGAAALARRSSSP